MRFRPTLIPTLITVPALTALLTLGFWQLHRLDWKETLIDRLQARAETPAEVLPAGSLSEIKWEYRNVTVKGVFEHDREVHLLNRSLNGNPGLHVVTPLRRTDISPRETILIDRGWVPFDRKDPATRPQGQLQGEVEITGLVRFAKEPGSIQKMFLPENDPRKNMWYLLRPEEVSDTYRVELPRHYVLDGRTEIPGLFPVGRQWTLDLRNDHLQYAITWFAVAAGLLVIYITYHLKRERE